MPKLGPWFVVASIAGALVGVLVWDAIKVRLGAYREVVQINTGSGFCSGVLINQQHVVTAKHCVEESHGSLSVRNSYGDLPAAWVRKQHPQLDLAVLCLATRTFNGAVALPKQGQVGSRMPFRAVGYGLFSDSSTMGSWKARVGASKIDNVADTRFRAVRGPAVACRGDSGGPAFAATNPKTLLGIVERYGPDDKYCGDPILYTRVDTAEVLHWLSNDLACS